MILIPTISIVISTPRVKWELVFVPEEGFFSPEGVVFGPRNGASANFEGRKQRPRAKENPPRDEIKEAPISHKVRT
jgi:hypothetical protein